MRDAHSAISTVLAFCIRKQVIFTAGCRFSENPLSAKRLVDGALEGTNNLHTAVPGTCVENVSPFSLVQESTIIYPTLQMKLWVRRQGRRWLR